jgi:alpha-beta hydrolase superfamily lysophospholipase
VSDDLLHTRDGLALRLRHRAGRAPARGNVLIVHGLGEHGGRHGELAETLNRDGWHTWVHDQRGHGDSEGPRGGLHRQDDLLADLAVVIDFVRSRHAGPLLLFGHSLGGLVAARFVAEGLADTPAAWFRPVDALALSSPGLAVKTSPFQKVLLALMTRAAPDVAVGNGLRPAWLSRDPAVVAAYLADPKVHDRITARLGRFLVDEGPVVRAAAARWRVPTLLLWGGDDRCVDPDGSAVFAAMAPTSLVESRCFAELRHEIFHEPERATVIAVLLDWLDTRFPAQCKNPGP